MRRLALASAAAVLLVSSTAAAQMSTGELTDNAHESRVAADLGFFYRTFDLVLFTGDFGALQPSVYASYKVADVAQGFLVLDFAWRAIGTWGSTSAFRALNPYFGARFGMRGQLQDGTWRARGGLGLTLPLSNVYDDWNTAGIMGIGVAGGLSGMQAAWDTWLAAPLTMSLVGRGDFEYRTRSWLAGVEGGLAAMFPVTYKGMTGSTNFIMQIGGYGAWRPIPELAVGLRLQAVLGIPTQSGASAEGYTALMPFVRGEFGDWFVEGRWVLNLDEPFGWAYDGGTGTAHVWAVYVYGGLAF